MRSGRELLRTIERAGKSALVASLRLGLSSARAPHPLPNSFQRILVVRQHNQLGDMLCVVPLLRALRERYPAASIALVASPVNCEVMQNNRYVDEVINFDKREFLKVSMHSPGLLARFVGLLRAHQFELAIVPSTVSTSFTSDLLAYLSGAPLRIGAGSTDGKVNPSALFFNLPVLLDWRANPHRHQTLRNLDIAAAVVGPAADLSPEMTLTSDEIAEGISLFRKALGTRRLGIGLHPGAGKAPNRWPAERFALVANALANEFNVRVFVTEGPMDAGPVSNISNTLSVIAEYLVNQPIRRVASIIRNLSLVISNDTGVMHIAAAVGVPVLSLFGPTDPDQWAPFGRHNRYIQGRGGDITSIPVDEVLQHAREMLRIER